MWKLLLAGLGGAIVGSAGTIGIQKLRSGDAPEKLEALAGQLTEQAEKLRQAKKAKARKTVKSTA